MYELEGKLPGILNCGPILDFPDNVYQHPDARRWPVLSVQQFSGIVALPEGRSH